MIVWKINRSQSRWIKHTDREMRLAQDGDEIDYIINLTPPTMASLNHSNQLAVSHCNGQIRRFRKRSKPIMQRGRGRREEKWMKLVAKTKTNRHCSYDLRLQLIYQIFFKAFKSYRANRQFSSYYLLTFLDILKRFLEP